MLRILTALSCILIALVSFAAEQSESREANIIQALTDLSAHLPQQYLSLDAVADHNDYDAEKIITWVSRNIHYSPSPGYQLTPENALLTATGNALEQAMLLQNVLTQAGFEVRIARAKLDAQTANELLKQSFFESPVRQWELNDQIRDRFFKKFEILYQQPENSLLNKYMELSAVTPWPKSTLFQDSRKLAQTLYSAINMDNAWKIPDSDLALQPWLEIAQDYYFVNYRLSQGDEWQQAHPAFVENEPDVETSTYFTDDITNQYHQVTLQAFITRQTAEKTEVVAVTPLIKRSSIELFEHQLTFITASSIDQAASDKKTDALKRENNFFIPAVDGKVLDDTRVFNLYGEDYSAAEALDPIQKLVTTVREKLSGAGSNLDSLAVAEKNAGVDEQAISSTLLDYHFIISWQSPTGNSRELKRVIYQKDNEGSDKVAIDAITQRVLLAAEPATFSPVVEFNEQLKSQISIFNVLKKAREQDFSEAQTMHQLYRLYQTLKDLRFNNTLAFSRQNESAQQFFSAIPMLAMMWDRGNSNTDAVLGTISFDYLINATQVVRLSDGLVQPDPVATSAYGVWSTYSEALVQANNLQGNEQLSREKLPESVLSSAGQFNKASTQGKNVEIVSNIDQLEKLPQLSSAGKEMLASEMSLNPNYIFVIPNEIPDKGFVAYYRVNTKTAETLGYSEFGTGLTMAEYDAIFAWYTVRLIGSTLGLMNCLVGEEVSLKSLGCSLCVMVTGVVGILTVGVTLTAAGVFASAAPLTFCQVGSLSAK